MVGRAAVSAVAAAALSAGVLSAGALGALATPGPVFTPTKGSIRVEAIRIADPDGGPSWGVRSFELGGGETCEQFGRVAHGKFGAIDDKGRLVRVPYRIDDCVGISAAPLAYGFGGVQTNVPAGGCKYPVVVSPPPGVTPPAPDPRPTCTAHETRVIVHGVFGGDLVRVTVAAPPGHHPQRLRIGPRGDFFYVMRGDGLTEATKPVVALTFNSGCRRAGRSRLRLHGTHRAGRCKIVMPDMLGPLPSPPR